MSRRAAIAVAAALAAFAAAALPLGLRMTQQAAIAARSGPTARSYVQDGLVAMWDGIENAGWGVHTGTGEIWKDLVGTNDLKFAKRWGDATGNQATWGDACAIKTNNVDFGGWAYLVSSNGGRTSQPQLFAEVAKTLEIHVWIDECRSGQGDAMLLCNMNQASDSIYLVINADRKYMCTTRSSDDFTGTFVWDYAYPFATAHTIATTKADDGYCDGVALARSTIVDNWADRSAFYIGGENYGHNRSFTGEIYCIRIYSRVLTPAEIAHNAAIDRRRFGTAADADK